MMRYECKKCGSKFLLVIGFVFILIISTIGCISDQDRFIGEWRDQDGDTHHFFSDGTFNSILHNFDESTTQSGMWEINDNKLVISTLGGTVTYNYSFSNNDNTIRCTGLKTMILSKW